MPLNLLDIKKFCTKIIFNICKCITNFSLIVNGGDVGAEIISYYHSGVKLPKCYSGDWNTQLVSQDYPQENLSRLQKLLEWM